MPLMSYVILRAPAGRVSKDAERWCNITFPSVERRRAPRLAGLFEGVGQAQQHRLAPGAAGEGDAERVVRGVNRPSAVVRARDEAGRHLDARIARLGGDRRAGDTG